MAVEVQPKFATHKILGGDNPGVEEGYLIVGAEEKDEALRALLAYLPTTNGNAPLQTPGVEEIADGIWESTVTWSFNQLTPPTQEDDEFATSFTTKGGKTKLTQSRGTRIYKKEGETAPDFQGAIGVERNGTDLQVQGVEVTIPHLSFSKSRRYEADWLTADRLKTLAALSGSTNSTPFLGFAAGELLFEGAEGNQKSSDAPVDVKFDFSASQNVTGQTFGGIEGIEKKGWEYLWFLFKTSVDEDALELVKRPIAAYVEEVSPSANFDDLGM